MVCKLKRLPTEWEKIFSGYMSDKELITRLYMEIENSPKSMTQLKNGQNI
jgi:hypothetical protein